MIEKIILIILDSVGAGEMPDSAEYGDKGADTLGHIFKFMGQDYSLANMEKLGLYKILNLKSSLSKDDILGCYGKMATKSRAKDTTSGHWEMAGIILEKPFPVFPNGFPDDLICEFEKRIGVKIIGNCAASGTEIINRLGDEHVETGFPIVYTSADSVFQIAAHEKLFGLDNLYKISKIARELLTGDYGVGRVIARPFLGENGNYYRTQNRRDFSLDPVGETILDILKAAGANTVAVGKIEDIFNFRGITKSIHSKSNKEGMRVTLDETLSEKKGKTLIFTNLVDFDMLWGHRRDIVSYANGLKEFDNYLPQLLSAMTDKDMLIITADHGCDPSYKAHTDHTREYVPLLVYGKALKKGADLGIRDTLSDIDQTIADIFNVSKMKNGKSFKEEIL
ncbi:MAG: phosphopentomutase [Elusimicrobiota bacterium]|jgi:phosphopentomutase|nr:phosphopentomutase [Elusimicrobiota bacterium]